MKKWLQRIAGIVQVSGGFIGAAQIIEHLTSFSMDNPGSILAVVFLLVFLFILISGVLLLEGNAKGMLWSMIAQGLQIPFISFPFFAYKLIAGLDVNLYWIGNSGGLNYSAGSHWLLSLHGGDIWGIGVNLFALVMFLCLWRLK